MNTMGRLNLCQSTHCIGGEIVATLNLLSQQLTVIRTTGKAVFGARIRTRLHITIILLNTLFDDGRKICVFLDKFRGKLIEHSEKIMGNEHLPVTMNASPDSNGRNAQPGRDALRHRGRNTFQDHGETSGFLQEHGFVQEGGRGFFSPALDPVAPEPVHRLGRQTKMPHHGNLGVQQGLDGFGPDAASFDLHGADPCFLHQPQSVPHRLGRTDEALGSPRWFQCSAPLIGVVFLLISLQVWKFGVRHYRSTGS